MSKVTMEEVLDFINTVDIADTRYELAKLRAIREWAVQQLPVDYEIGDRVEIVATVPTNNGWRAYREALALGQTAEVVNIDFASGTWQVSVVLDRPWVVVELGGKVSRFWRGRASDTPDGFEPPSEWEQKECPEGKRVRFSFRPEWIRRVREVAP